MSHFCKRFFMIAAAVCVLLPLGAMAQQEQGTGQGKSGSDQTSQQTPGRMHRGARYRHAQRMLAKRLNLTDDQKQQFQQINRKARQQAVAIRNDSSLSDADKQQKLQDLRKQTVQQRIGVLTPEQQDELKKIREERRKQHGQDKTSQNKEDDEDIFAGMTSDDGGPTTSPLL